MIIKYKKNLLLRSYCHQAPAHLTSTNHFFSTMTSIIWKNAIAFVVKKQLISLECNVHYYSSATDLLLCGYETYRWLLSMSLFFGTSGSNTYLEITAQQNQFQHRQRRIQRGQCPHHHSLNQIKRPIWIKLWLKCVNITRTMKPIFIINLFANRTHSNE